jgi:hypothetical protein
MAESLIGQVILYLPLNVDAIAGSGDPLEHGIHDGPLLLNDCLVPAIQKP